MLYTNFQKIVKEVFPNSFHEASLTLLPRPDENITRKLEINTHLEHGHKKKSKQNLVYPLQQYIKGKIKANSI